MTFHNQTTLRTPLVESLYMWYGTEYSNKAGGFKAFQLESSSLFHGARFHRQKRYHRYSRLMTDSSPPHKSRHAMPAKLYLTQEIRLDIVFLFRVVLILFKHITILRKSHIIHQLYNLIQPSMIQCSACYLHKKFVGILQ